MTSDIMGNRVISGLMLAALARLDGLEICSIRLRPEDLRPHRVRWWTRVSPSLGALRVLRANVRQHAHGPYDLVVVTTWVAAIAVRDLIRHVPTLASMDQVPSNMAEVTVLQTRSRLRRLIKRLLWRIEHRRFAPVARDIDVYLPRTRWVRDALVRDYGVARDRCHVTLGPQDLVRWRPRPRIREARLRLLFVGNDFTRKGGALLLEMYREHLADIATLTIATQDDLSSEGLPSGVDVVRGRVREELLELFQASDIFLFPTRQDMMGQVLAEALATGLPCMATDIAGVGDLVKDGHNGFLMPYAASAREWAARVRFLHERRDVLDEYASAARRFAESHLDVRAFDRLILQTVDELKAGKLALRR